MRRKVINGDITESKIPNAMQKKYTTSGNLKVSRVKEENSKSILKQHVINLLNIMVYIVGKELIAGSF